ncbi:baseplate J/gp47 family protein [Paenibacillus sp. FSL R5-0527]|uniref:baseplate assembly protein n=1 Tax=Paenibacillus sp. FSL R5-0527 TaxID=2975321 RepID=UPI00097B9710|nr:baseplate J protein [Paenibacillus macerans]
MADLKFIDDDPQTIIDSIITIHEAITGRTLYPADPERLFLLSLAQIIVQQRVLINSTARQNLLRYATGDVLDGIGEMYDTSRLPAEAARTTIQISLSIPLASATIIPAGTRVGPQGGGGELFFITSDVLQIPAGAVTGSVPALCSVPGIAGNGFTAGQINALIDPLPFVQSVTNTTESSGGADTETDDAYRQRIRSAPESFSVAGPAGAYEIRAKSASSAIIDVAVDSPAPVEVVLAPLLAGGKIPTQDVLDAVLAAVTERDVRPLTDKVTVQAPVAVPYNINLTYYIARSRAAETTSIQQGVTAAVNGYVTWQKSKLGRDINPSELIARVMAAGALRVRVTEPAFTDLSRFQVAQDATVTTTFGGLEDD